MSSYIPVLTSKIEDYQRIVENNRVDAKKGIRQALQNKKSASWGNIWNAQVQPRGANLLFAVGNVFAGAVDMAIGAVEETVDILSIGYIGSGSRFYCGCERILSNPYKNVIRVLNPGASFPDVRNIDDYIRRIYKSCGGDWYKGYRDSNTSNFFVRHLAGRVCAVSSFLALVVARIAFLVVGIFAAALSLLSLGNYETANKWAKYGLEFPLIINDLGRFLKQFTRLA